MNRKPFGIGEWYHCFNRGVDKRKIFMERQDYERFLMLLYSANDAAAVRIGEIRAMTFVNALKLPRTQPLVDIGAYCLMPNHFHLLLREITEGGIALFMQKMGGYTMYFNVKENRSGSLFAGTFKSKQVTDDRYLKRVTNYIHANAAELIEPRWKEGLIKDKNSAFAFLNEYRYSSFPDYQGTKTRPEANILNRASLLDCYDDLERLSVHTLFADAQDFAQTADEF